MIATRARQFTFIYRYAFSRGILDVTIRENTRKEYFNQFIEILLRLFLISQIFCFRKYLGNILKIAIETILKLG